MVHDSDYLVLAIIIVAFIMFLIALPDSEPRE